MNNLDSVLQSQIPTVMVPRYTPFQPLESNGRRFLAASNGLWIEERTDWMHAVWPLALQDQVAMPYGTLEKRVTFLYGDFPVDLVSKFLEDAREQFPKECAAWITWNREDRTFQYRLLKALDAGTAKLDYECPCLPENEVMICDIHSHGRHAAEFSPKDDEDDNGITKIMAVVGQVNTWNTMKFRLSIAGLKIPLKTKSINELSIG